MVPTSYFERSFSRFNLYFFDQTGSVLLPDPVFLPRGEQTATSLVRGLLRGPGTALRGVSRSAFPSRTALDLSVVVTESGVAEVPLSREVLQMAPAELFRAVDQLAWTLRQVPGITRVRVTVGGAPVPLPNGRHRRLGRQRRGARRLRCGRRPPALGAARWPRRRPRVQLRCAGARVRWGRPATPCAASRSATSRVTPRRWPATARASSSRAADAQSGSRQVDKVLPRGTDILRPSYDMFGQLWLVDRTPAGAKVYVVRGQQTRELRIPGVTGQDVAAFSVARDGSRVAFGFGGAPAPAVRVVDILRTDEGVVTGPGESRGIRPAPRTRRG